MESTTAASATNTGTAQAEKDEIVLQSAKRSKSSFVYALMLLLVFLFFVKSCFLSSPGSHNSDEREKFKQIMDSLKKELTTFDYLNQTTSDQTTATDTDDWLDKLEFDHKEVIGFDSTYGAVYYFSSFRYLVFYGATQDYCVLNKKHIEYCGKKGEDITPELPKGKANMELQFRTPSKDSASIEVYVYKLKQIN